MDPSRGVGISPFCSTADHVMLLPAQKHIMKILLYYYSVIKFLTVECKQIIVVYCFFFVSKTSSSKQVDVVSHHHSGMAEPYRRHRAADLQLFPSSKLQPLLHCKLNPWGRSNHLKPDAETLKRAPPFWKFNKERRGICVRCAVFRVGGHF